MTRILIAILAFSFLCSSCKKIVGRGPSVTESRTHSNFSSVNLNMSASLYISQGSSYSVVVEAEENILNEIITQVNGNTLTIKHRNNVWLKSDGIKVTVTLPHLNNLEVSGSGEIYGLTSFQSDQFHIDISGSGSIEMPVLQVQTLDANISGSGKITIKGGSAQQLKSDISGSGDLYSKDMVCQQVETHTSGSGTTKVYATQNLDVKISGSGDVYYKGNPTVNTSISGSGKVVHED